MGAIIAETKHHCVLNPHNKAVFFVFLTNGTPSKSSLEIEHGRSQRKMQLLLEDESSATTELVSDRKFLTSGHRHRSCGLSHSKEPP